MLAIRLTQTNIRRTVREHGWNVRYRHLTLYRGASNTYILERLRAPDRKDRTPVATDAGNRTATQQTAGLRKRTLFAQLARGWSAFVLQ
jgi:hypothetical protein